MQLAEWKEPGIKEQSGADTEMKRRVPAAVDAVDVDRVRPGLLHRINCRPKQKSDRRVIADLSNTPPCPVSLLNRDTRRNG